jgi:Ca2+-dependent lipid-binding protein, contains C2 domain
MSGHLTVKIIDGALRPIQETNGKIDPYVKVSVGEKSAQTKPSKGQYPSWGSQFTIKVGEDEEMINFEVRAASIPSKDELIGAAEETLASVIHSDLKYAGWISLKNGTETTGEIQIEMTFYPDQNVTTGAESLPDYNNYGYPDYPQKY